MVNVQREVAIPAALSTPEIQSYINDAIQYLLNPNGQQKPEKPASYRSSDLLEAFDRCFSSKCYLTEMKFANSWIMDIEHFVPQNERPDLVYSWTNLFPCEHYSNMIKPRITPAGGYLNPCDPNDDVEVEIRYSLSVYGEEPYFEARDGQNLKAINTANLLQRVHNGHDLNTSKGTAELRHAIHKKYIQILNKIVEWQHHPDGSDQKFQAARELKDLLSRRSSFTMLVRSIPAVRLLPPEFLD